MAILKNRAGVATSTVGTGPITLGVALTSATQPNAASWQTFAAAGVANGDRVRYLILDSNGSWEYGEAVYTATGTVLARASGAMDGSVPGQKSSTGALLALTGTAQVFITAVAEDLSRVVFTAVSSVNQTGIVTETFTKVNFGSVGINDGSYYNAGTSRWIPPAGRCQLEASISANNVLLGTPIILGFNKNGASY